MDIENQIIRIRVNNFNEKHFKELGYVFKLNDYLEIPAHDLPNGSGTKIDVECHYCGKIFKKSYRRYLETKDNLCCENCKNKKMMETSLRKYGNVCSLRNPKVGEKAKKTNLEKLGVEYPFQNPEILKKCVETSIKRYGKDYRSKSITKPQRYLHELYGGELNFSVFPYLLDICFIKDKIDFEYDGGAHDLAVRTGQMTAEEFQEKEKNRTKYLLEKEFKEFRIVSKTDVLPSDDILIKIKERAFDLLLNQNYNSYIYDLDNESEIYKV